ncbi:hypothetical protein KBJ98_04990 [Flavobacterium sp. F-328]|uniref:DUF4377 domain-containing protein n=1 Tax=Flavobacterium erciyesense TaxID=2825842 RepID=A0ABS5D210_9FLAO|nr:hypothetical protein [Flavobacterium erciyesense]MBQ0908051.1 hypothetical protein [Flavobacterium erciyesense]
MKKILAILLFTISVCSAQKTEKTIVTIPNAPGIVYEIGNGEIFESAVKIKNAKNKEEGIDAENKYLEYKYGLMNVGWKPFGSEFYEVKRKTYNLIHIEILKKDANAESEMTTVYFEITECLKEK